MADSRVVFVTDDSTIAQQVQSYLREQVACIVHADSYTTVASQLTFHCDGLLLLNVSTLAEQIQARQLVQQIVLQKWPAPIVILENQGANSPLAELDPHISRRLRWPEDASLLTGIVNAMDRSQQFRFAHRGGLEQMLTDQLLAMTPSLWPMADHLALAATHDVTVLLEGETGVGKTFLARLIHDNSHRRNHRLMTVPCGAISANLIESEFFGHVKGAFSGADRFKVGKFAAAGQGTLLLDEIDTLGLEQQAALLRVIETGEFEPVGGNDTEYCKARLVFASNIDLEKAVALGKFRADLYFRLNVMSFHLPPLRERLSDIEPLARGMAVRFARKFKKDLFDIHWEAMAALEAYSWPGNLRQLENVIQHGVLMSNGPQLLLAHLPVPRQQAPNPIHDDDGNHGETLQHQRAVAESAVIHRALASNGFNRTRAADALGISRVTLYKKMRKYGLLNESAEV